MYSLERRLCTGLPEKGLVASLSHYLKQARTLTYKPWCWFLFSSFSLVLYRIMPFLLVFFSYVNRMAKRLWWWQPPALILQQLIYCWTLEHEPICLIKSARLFVCFILSSCFDFIVYCWSICTARVLGSGVCDWSCSQETTPTALWSVTARLYPC